MRTSRPSLISELLLEGQEVVRTDKQGVTDLERPRAIHDGPCGSALTHPVATHHVVDVEQVGQLRHHQTNPSDDPL